MGLGPYNTTWIEHDDALWLSRAMRRQLAGVGISDGMSEMLNIMKKTKSNRDLITWAKQQG